MSAFDVITDAYNYVFIERSDIRVHSWPLLSRPTELIMIIAVYIFAIRSLLPTYMAHRKPYSLKEVIAVYNLFQVASCSLLMYGIITSGWTTHLTVGCQNVDYTENPMAMRMARFMWWHMILKLAELVETVFFVLRKKYNQVSFLHVYHHSSTFFFAWLCAKYYAGGMYSFTVIINSFIHILMYGYYFLSSVKIWEKGLEKIKPFLTIAQMAQLCIIFVHSTQALLPGCDVAKNVPLLYLPNIALNIYLFSKFFAKSYIRRKQS